MRGIRDRTDRDGRPGRSYELEGPLRERDAVEALRGALRGLIDLLDTLELDARHPRSDRSRRSSREVVRARGPAPRTRCGRSSPWSSERTHRPPRHARARCAASEIGQIATLVPGGRTSSRARSANAMRSKLSVEL